MTKRYPFAPGIVKQTQRRNGEFVGKFNEVRNQEAPTVTLPVRSSIAGREVRHFFQWARKDPLARTDGLMAAAGYPNSHLPKMINSGPRGINRNRIRPTMSPYPRPSSQGGMATPPRFVKVNKVKQNLYQPPTY